MNRDEQLRHAADLPARVQEVVLAVENAPKELGMAVVSSMLQSVLARYNDAKFEIRAQIADNIP